MLEQNERGSTNEKAAAVPPISDPLSAPSYSATTAAMPDHRALNGTLPVASLDPEWNLSNLFATPTAWEDEYRKLSVEFSAISQFQGRLGDSAQNLFKGLEAMHGYAMRAELLENYATLGTLADTLDGDAQNRQSRSLQLQSQVLASQAFIEPELLALNTETLTQLVESSPTLASYRRYFENLEKLRAHTLDAQAEKLLAVFQPTLSDPESFYNALNNKDLKFRDITVGNQLVAVHHGNIDTLIRSTDRQVRQAAFESRSEAYQALSNGFTEALTHQARASLRIAQLRDYGSTLKQNLFNEQIPESAFHIAAQMCDRFRPLVQRFFTAKAGILGIEKLEEHDIHAPLSNRFPVIDYPKAVEFVLSAVEPLGAKYQSIARAGFYDRGWVDAQPRENKYSNALSAGVYGGQPYILLSYNGSVKDASILAHELGHSVHSEFTHEAQPRCYANYAMTVAETASNLNQVLMRDLLLKNGDREMTLAVIDEAFYTIHRYLFLFPTLSKVEHMVHSTYAAGGAVSTDDLREFTVREFSEAYGSSVAFDPAAVGIRWAEYSHLFAPYYLFKYGVGMCAGMAVGQRILEGDTNLRDRYLEVLASGSSQSPVKLFQHVDIDITSPEPYEQALKVVESYVELLERF
jgi:oligoendopeptidase F